MYYIYFVVEDVGAGESVEKSVLPRKTKDFYILEKGKTDGKKVE